MSAPLDTRLRAETLRGTRRPLPSGIPFRLTAIPSAPFRGFWSVCWSNVGQHTCSCLESRYPQPFCGVHTYVVVALRRRVSKATVKWKRYNATSRHYRARLFFEVGVGVWEYRKREICTSGSVRDEDGQPLHLLGRRTFLQLAAGAVAPLSM